MGTRPRISMLSFQSLYTSNRASPDCHEFDVPSGNNRISAPSLHACARSKQMQPLFQAFPARQGRAPHLDRLNGSTAAVSQTQGNLKKARIQDADSIQSEIQMMKCSKCRSLEVSLRTMPRRRITSGGPQFQKYKKVPTGSRWSSSGKNSQDSLHFRFSPKSRSWMRPLVPRHGLAWASRRQHGWTHFLPFCARSLGPTTLTSAHVRLVSAWQRDARFRVPTSVGLSADSTGGRASLSPSSRWLWVT